jgi:hypothetical protein
MPAEVIDHVHVLERRHNCPIGLTSLDRAGVALIDADLTDDDSDDEYYDPAIDLGTDADDNDGDDASVDSDDDTNHNDDDDAVDADDGHDAAADNNERLS